MNLPHGSIHPVLSTALYFYQAATPGVQAASDTTVLLGDDAEPQPDLLLRVLPEWGGQSRNTADEYVAGAPELIAEIAYSSIAIDLHAKREDYRRYGVREYLVLSLRERQLHWFDLPNNQELRVADDGILRAKMFPGLWIHAPALLGKNFQQFVATPNQGLATPEHGQFVQELSARQRRTV